MQAVWPGAARRLLWREQQQPVGPTLCLQVVPRVPAGHDMHKLTLDHSVASIMLPVDPAQITLRACGMALVLLSAQPQIKPSCWHVRSWQGMHL